jgi:hypothetical protein
MGVLVCILLIGVAGNIVWSAVRVWGDPRQARTEARKWDRLGERGAWAVTRSIVAVAAMFVCIALMVTASAAADALVNLHGPLQEASSAFLVMMLACWLVIASIAIFNRPRFLVPPHLRDKRRP